MQPRPLWGMDVGGGAGACRFPAAWAAGDGERPGDRSIIGIDLPIGRYELRTNRSNLGRSPKHLVEMSTDAPDQLLLSLLRENARLSTAEIARRLRLSRTTVQARIERLERAGIIRGYTVRVHDDYERGYIRAHIMITVQPKQMTPVVTALRAMSEVRTLQSVSGPYDLIALGMVADVNKMDVLTDRIGAIEGVERTTSSIILSTKFER